MSIIDNRKSVRIFSEEEVNEDKLIKLVEAGMCAPSSKNKQPWQFIILSDKNLLQKFAEFHPSWRILKNGSKAIVVCGDLDLDEREVHTVMTCAAASQNILLRAVELNLGAVWLGMYPDKERVEWTKETLSMSEKQFPISLIAVGYPGDVKEKKRVFNEDKIHFNKW